jgi:hypothetical protein
MSDENENLNLVDADVEELEKRLELVHGGVHPMGYYCFNDCKGDFPVKPAPNVEV